MIVLYIFIAFAISFVPVNTAFENCKNIDKNNTENSTETCVEVFLLTSGVHTCIVLPGKTSVKDWTAHINPTATKTDNPNTK